MSHANDRVRHRIAAAATVVLIAGIARWADADFAAAQARNCPENADQVVPVIPGQPTPFRLLVNNLGAAQVTIFQYPLGGVLLQEGPTPLDFVFQPQQGFSGSTDFTYRIIPPVGCPRSVQLGKVTLVGGASDSTAAGLVPTVPGSLCGVNSLMPMALCAAFVATGRCVGLARRRRRAG